MSGARGNIFLAGVGGQGILLASEVLGEAFLRGGYDVKKSEVHGMAQRGGAVTTHLRFGPEGLFAADRAGRRRICSSPSRRWRRCGSSITSRRAASLW